MATLPSIKELNTLGDAAFKEVVGILFELAPPLERRFIPLRPFSSYQSLIDEGRKRMYSFTGSLFGVLLICGQ